MIIDGIVYREKETTKPNVVTETVKSDKFLIGIFAIFVIAITVILIYRLKIEFDERKRNDSIMKIQNEIQNEEEMEHQKEKEKEEVERVKHDLHEYAEKMEENKDE